MPRPLLPGHLVGPTAGQAAASPSAACTMGDMMRLWSEGLVPNEDKDIPALFPVLPDAKGPTRLYQASATEATSSTSSSRAPC